MGWEPFSPTLGDGQVWAPRGKEHQILVSGIWSTSLQRDKKAALAHSHLVLCPASLKKNIWQYNKVTTCYQCLSRGFKKHPLFLSEQS